MRDCFQTVNGSHGCLRHSPCESVTACECFLYGERQFCMPMSLSERGERVCLSLMLHVLFGLAQWTQTNMPWMSPLMNTELPHLPLMREQCLFCSVGILTRVGGSSQNHSPLLSWQRPDKAEALALPRNTNWSESERLAQILSTNGHTHTHRPAPDPRLL